jgi:hypothetical protein
MSRSTTLVTSWCHVMTSRFLGWRHRDVTPNYLILRGLSSAASVAQGVLPPLLALVW